MPCGRRYRGPTCFPVYGHIYVRCPSVIIKKIPIQMDNATSRERDVRYEPPQTRRPSSCVSQISVLLMLRSLKAFKPRSRGPPSPDVLDFAITHYGPNMRRIQDALVEPTGPERHIETAVRNLRPSALDYIVRTQCGFDVTHSLIMSFASPRAVDATDPTYFESDKLTHSVANGHIWRLLLASFTLHQHIEAGRMILSFTSIPQASTTADWLFETWVHRELSQGGERNLYPMQQVGQKLQSTTDETQALTISLPMLTKCTSLRTRNHPHKGATCITSPRMPTTQHSTLSFVTKLTGSGFR